jgi:peroxiredoxin/poly(3-hydroxybutyrate) depolymerase
MRGFMCSITLLSLIFATSSVAAPEDDAYEKLSINYSGGDYKDETFGYRLLKPQNIEKGNKYPLILFLHGAGERGDENARQLIHFCRMMATAEYRKEYPCYILAPQCRKDKNWRGDQMNVAIAAFKKTIKENVIDEDRIYLTGLSMGGYGSWSLGAQHPKWFAAVAPICGGGRTDQAKNLVGLPLWTFHGDKDKAVPVERSRQMIKAIKDAGGDPKYTEYPGVGHNSWTRAYSNKKPDGLMAWMFKQKRKTKASNDKNSDANNGDAKIRKAAAASAKQVEPLKVGDRVPDIKLKNALGQTISLITAVKEKPTVLVFFRGGWCMFCNRQMQDLAKAHSQLQAIGYQVIGISADSVENAAVAVKKIKAPFTVLGDPKVEAISAFGLAFQMDEQKVKRYASFGVSLDKASGQGHHVLPVPAVFITGTDGKIRYRHYDPDYRKRLASTMLIAEAKKALQ